MSNLASWPIAVLPPRLQRAGLLLLGMPPDASLLRRVDQAVTQAETADDSFNGLLGAWDGDRLLGVVWAQLLPGRTATIWPPRVPSGGDALGRRLAAAAIEVAIAHGARLAQSMTPLHDTVEQRWLAAAGLRPVTEMESLAWEVTAATKSATAVALNVWRFVLYDPSCDGARMERILEQTCTGSLDCPGLESVRSAAEILQGYRAAGDTEDRHWQFLCRDETDAGCLLLAGQSQSREMELVYMGLAPPWRGRGLGLLLVHQAQDETRRAGYHRLVTAVDAANVPARAAYLSAGFHCWDRRRVLLRVF
jgi:GNAT superfamily N-acetyltransferase